MLVCALWQIVCKIGCGGVRGENDLISKSVFRISVHLTPLIFLPNLNLAEVPDTCPEAELGKGKE